MPNSDSPILLTFAPMIDSELCRFVLVRYGIAYREAPHLFGWASVLSTWHGWTPQIPLLYAKGYGLAGPHAIVDRFDAPAPAERRLLPADPALRAEVDKDWDSFNNILGSATAIVAYYHLLPCRDIMLEPFGRGIPPTELSLLPSVYPVLAGLFRLLLGLNAKNAATQLDQVRTIFDATDRRIGDGRAFLVGDALTLSDLALATSAAPVLLPDGYGSPIPPLAVMPPDMAAIVAEMRQRPTARFVERIYRDYRAAPPTR